MRVLSVNIERWRALEGVNLQFNEDAKLICLVGANGTGKSTVLDLISSAAHSLGVPRTSTDIAQGKIEFGPNDIASVTFRLDPEFIEIEQTVSENAGVRGAGAFSTERGRIQALMSEWDRVVVVRYGPNGESRIELPSIEDKIHPQNIPSELNYWTTRLKIVLQQKRQTDETSVVQLIHLGPNRWISIPDDLRGAPPEPFAPADISGELFGWMVGHMARQRSAVKDWHVQAETWTSGDQWVPSPELDIPTPQLSGLTKVLERMQAGEIQEIPRWTGPRTCPPCAT